MIDGTVLTLLLYKKGKEAVKNVLKYLKGERVLESRKVEEYFGELTKNDLIIKRRSNDRPQGSFKNENGFSKTSHYACGGKRFDVLTRDEYQCVYCGMSDLEHKSRWGRPITVDHKDKNRKNNDMGNMQTLCLSCHGRKDITPRLIEKKIEPYKAYIMLSRARGVPYQSIATHLGVSIASVWKWARIWGDKTNIRRKK